MQRRTEGRYNRILNGIKDFWWKQYITTDFRRNPNGLIYGLDTSLDYQERYAPDFPRELVLMAMKEAGRDIVEQTEGQVFPHYDTHRKTWRFFRLVEVWDDDLMLAHQNETKEQGHRNTSQRDYDLIKDIHPKRLEEEIKLVDIRTPQVGSGSIKRVRELINSIREEKQ